MRVDSALYAGATVPPYYDSLIAKLIVHDHSRAACIARLRRALGEYVIVGLSTNIPLLQAIAEDPAFVAGDYHINWLRGAARGAARPQRLSRRRALVRRAAAAAMPERMLALTPDLLLCAYASGLFPMANDRHDPTIHWIEPRRRGVLPLDALPPAEEPAQADPPAARSRSGSTAPSARSSRPAPSRARSGRAPGSTTI